MKKIILTSLLLVGLIAGVAYAHGSGYGMNGYGGHMMGGGHHGMMGDYGYRGGYGDCPGATGYNRDGWNSETQQKFLDETAGLRKEMHNKRFEYMEMQRNPNTTQAELLELEKEVLELRDKIHEKAEQLR